ncbi:unnamed protein product, partial [Phaeothamnion confervicola]
MHRHLVRRIAFKRSCPAVYRLVPTSPRVSLAARLSSSAAAVLDPEDSVDAASLTQSALRHRSWELSPSPEVAVASATLASSETGAAGDGGDSFVSSASLPLQRDGVAEAAAKAARSFVASGTARPPQPPEERHAPTLPPPPMPRPPPLRQAMAPPSSAPPPRPPLAGPAAAVASAPSASAPRRALQAVGLVMERRVAAAATMGLAEEEWRQALQHLSLAGLWNELAAACRALSSPAAALKPDAAADLCREALIACSDATSGGDASGGGDGGGGAAALTLLELLRSALAAVGAGPTST